MADDTNVTELPDNNQNQKGKPKSPQQILAELKGEFNGQVAKEFKEKAKAKMAEIKKIETSLRLAQAQLDEMIAQYTAETSA